MHTLTEAKAERPQSKANCLIIIFLYSIISEIWVGNSFVTVRRYTSYIIDCTADTVTKRVLR